MSLFELFLLGIGLSMDAFAVSVCKGMIMRKPQIKNAALISLFFGGFQALMPFIGWLLGRQFESVIKAYDHWIAFFLLAFLGGKMIFDALKKDGKEEKYKESADIKELFLLAVATSIDALAVGVTLAFLDVSLAEAVSVIGVTTFVITFCGVYIGAKTGEYLKDKAQIAGGVVLILIGIKILVEHLSGAA
ncbi:MAG: manganese efflux pump [Clostridia bacterium]|nr:manganese efflux pump [Clostridia bacterium]